MGWINKFTAVKAMNESRFFLFFVAIFDYHNLSVSGFLRSVAHPRSDHRWASLPKQDDVEPSLLILKDEAVVYAEENVLSTTEQDGELGNVVDEIASLSLEKNIEKFKCNECGSEYKKPWTLKNHIKKKHGEANLSGSGQTVERFHVCKVCSEVFSSKLALIDHQKLHLSCQICGRTCESKFALKRHIMCHKL